MKCKIQLVAVSEGKQENTVKDMAFLEKDSQRIEQLGWSVAESKEILKPLQKDIVAEQVESFLDAQRCCHDCGGKLARKEHKPITFGTLFGDIGRDSPGLYHCRCRSDERASFSRLATRLAEPTSPELLFIETKCACLVSYGLTVQALQDFLPIDDPPRRIDEKLNETTVREHILEVAERCEAELGLLA